MKKITLVCALVYGLASVAMAYDACETTANNGDTVTVGQMDDQRSCVALKLGAGPKKVTLTVTDLNGDSANLLIIRAYFLPDSQSIETVNDVGQVITLTGTGVSDMAEVVIESSGPEDSQVTFTVTWEEAAGLPPADPGFMMPHRH